MDTLEIIRQLRADPALADELRAVLLSQEFLQLPERIGRVELELTELRRELAEMDARLTSRLDAVEGRFDAVEGRLEAVEGRLDAVEGRLEAVEGRLDVGDRRLQNLEDGVSALKGGDLERRVRGNPRRYLGRVLEGAVLVSPDDFDISALDADEEQHLRDGDVIVRGKSGRSGPEVVALVETAWVAHQDDLDKATRRAPLLARVSGLPALPVVVSRERPAAVVIEHAQQSGVALVLASPAEALSTASPRTHAP